MFLAVFATHGTAHITWFDQPMRQIRSNPVAICLICALEYPNLRRSARCTSSGSRNATVRKGQSRPSQTQLTFSENVGAVQHASDAMDAWTCPGS